MCDDDLNLQTGFYELLQEHSDTLMTVVHPNDLVLKLLIAVLPEQQRQNLLSLLSSPLTAEKLAHIAPEPVYQKALNMVSGVCDKTTPYSY